MSDESETQVTGADESDGNAATVHTPTSANAISDTVWEIAIGNWVNDHVRNSPIAGATEAWNHLMGALPHLRSALETQLKAKE